MELMTLKKMTNSLGKIKSHQCHQWYFLDSMIPTRNLLEVLQSLVLLLQKLLELVILIRKRLTLTLPAVLDKTIRANTITQRILLDPN